MYVLILARERTSFFKHCSRKLTFQNNIVVICQPLFDEKYMSIGTTFRR
jgi:hypothetical protein